MKPALRPYLHCWPFVRGNHLGPVYFPHISNVDLCCLLCFKPEQAVEQTVALSVIPDAMALMWRHLDATLSSDFACIETTLLAKVSIIKDLSRLLFTKKTQSYGYRNSRYKNKTAWRPSHVFITRKNTYTKKIMCLLSEERARYL